MPVLFKAVLPGLSKKTALLLFVTLLPLPAVASSLEQNIDTASKTNDLGQKSQQQVSRLDNETEDLLNEYQRILQQADYQKAYNEELQQRLQEQEKEIQSLQQQIADVQITRLHILPLLREMVASLKQFIELDLPFEKSARLDSVSKLETLLATSSVSIADKFRRVMELYRAENDYSYEIGQYRDTVTIDSKPVSVELLRIGRSALYYQTLDGEHSALWDPGSKSWLALDAKYNDRIRQAMRVAAKQLPPQLLALPIKPREEK